MDMNNEETTRFCDNYERFYYTQTDEASSENKVKKPVPAEVETEIVNQCLSKGVFNIHAFRWKGGRLIGYDENGFQNKDDKDGNVVLKNGNGDSVDLDSIKEYVKKIESKQFIFGNCSFADLNEKFQLFNPDPHIDYFGPVNTINVLFFKTKGYYPIYDQFAHKAVKALFLKMSPQDVFIGQMKNSEMTRSKIKEKEDKDGPESAQAQIMNSRNKTQQEAVAMYYDYIWLLSHVFPEEYIGKVDGETGSQAFIPRKLDRALWVYGHQDKKWNGN